MAILPNRRNKNEDRQHLAGKKNNHAQEDQNKNKNKKNPGKLKGLVTANQFQPVAIYQQVSVPVPVKNRV